MSEDNQSATPSLNGLCGKPMSVGRELPALAYARCIVGFPTIVLEPRADLIFDNQHRPLVDFHQQIDSTFVGNRPLSGPMDMRFIRPIWC